MLLTKELEFLCTSQNKKWIEESGYNWSYYTKIIIPIDLVPTGCQQHVDVMCDYCLDLGIETIVSPTYAQFIISRNTISKDCCKKCRPLKVKECNLIKYGVESTNSLPETLNKRFNTNIDKYGSKSPTQNKEVKEKMKNTFLEVYGVTSPAKNEKVKEKILKTNIERYGAVSPTLNEKVRQKQINTMNEKYDVSYPMQNTEIKTKAMNTMFENNSAPTSRQQLYIHDLLGGEINYPHKEAFLDIAYVDEKIYLKIDLGGHELRVKLGNLTKEEYENKARNRWYALYRNGWKEIRIISSKDKIPSDEKLLEMMVYARSYLNEGRHYIKFFLDQGIVKTSQFELPYDFGQLRYIYKKDIIELK